MCPGPPTIGSMSAGEEAITAQVVWKVYSGHRDQNDHNAFTVTFQHKPSNGVAGGEPAVQVGPSFIIIILYR